MGIGEQASNQYGNYGMDKCVNNYGKHNLYANPKNRVKILRLSFFDKNTSQSYITLLTSYYDY